MGGGLHPHQPPPFPLDTPFGTVQWLYTILYSVGGILSSCDSEHRTAAAGSKLQGRARSCVLGSCHNLSGPLLLSTDARSRACVSHCPLMTCTERPSSSAHCPTCPLATRQTYQLLANLPPNNSILHLSILPTSLALGVSCLYPVGLPLHPRILGLLQDMIVIDQLPTDCEMSLW